MNALKISTVVVIANVSEVAQPIADHLLTLLRGA